MVTFTRRHYVMIGDMLRDLPDDLKLKWFNNWDRIFAEDNPRYQSDKFYAYVNPRVSEAAEDLARELRR